MLHRIAETPLPARRAGLDPRKHGELIDDTPAAPAPVDIGGHERPIDGDERPSVELVAIARNAARRGFSFWRVATALGLSADQQARVEPGLARSTPTD